MPDVLIRGLSEAAVVRIEADAAVVRVARLVLSWFPLWQCSRRSSPPHVPIDCGSPAVDPPRPHTINQHHNPVGR